MSSLWKLCVQDFLIKSEKWCKIRTKEFQGLLKEPKLKTKVNKQQKAPSANRVEDVLESAPVPINKATVLQQITVPRHRKWFGCKAACLVATAEKKNPQRKCVFSHINSCKLQY